jgi:hypothetical protein
MAVEVFMVYFKALTCILVEKSRKTTKNFHQESKFLAGIKIWYLLNS